MPLPEIIEVAKALNFETPDCRVVGGCDLYTTKAAGSDKKLYKNIENSLESQYAALLSLSAGLPASQAKDAGVALNLSRESAFGSLNQISSRRTFAYLIATLNASHSDYDFSHLLRPSDFRPEPNVRKVMRTLNTTLHDLRPRHSGVPGSGGRDGRPITPVTPNGSEKWHPRMWNVVDKQMSLGECSIYSYAPEDDPFGDEEDEPSLWSFNYFFFNKTRKRVCYIYLRGISMLGSETLGGAKTPTSILSVRPKRPASGTWSINNDEDTGRKRARFWFGDRAENAIIVGDDDDGEVEFLGERERTASEPEEEEHQIFEQLSDTASLSPCESRSKERSMSPRQRKEHKEPAVGCGRKSFDKTHHGLQEV